VGRERLELSL